jgi:Zn-dependent M16 (insulinase) family peptidase
VVIHSNNTVVDLKAVVSFTDQALKGVSKDFQVGLLQKYQAVTKEEVLDAFRNYFSPLFDPSSSIAVVVTAPSKTDEITDGLANQGFDVEKRTLEVDPTGEDDADSCSELEMDDNDESEQSGRCRHASANH